MIVIGFGRARHDCSVCAYIHGEIRYAKYEREIGVKHAGAQLPWFWQKLNEWGVNFDEIDLIVETDACTRVICKLGNPLNKVSYRLPHDGDDYHHIGKHMGNNITKDCEDQGFGNISLLRKIDSEAQLESVIKKKSSMTYQLLLDHHLAHAWSNSNFTRNSQALVIDGNGSGAHYAMLYSGKMNGKLITRFSSESGPQSGVSPANVLNNIGANLGFPPNIEQRPNPDNAGKVMGLFPYGKPDLALYESMRNEIRQKPRILAKKVSEIKATIPNEADSGSPGWQKVLTNISTINEWCYDIILNLIEKLDKSKPIIYSGGVALNVDWNRRLMDAGYNLLIEPHVYDGGLSVGCMRFGIDQLMKDPNWKVKFDRFPYVQNDIAPIEAPTEETISKVAELLAVGKIVGWYQGHGEIGPRALGNRSILMDPTIADGKNILNSKVKHREWFRPFGASVKRDKAAQYFDLEDNPYMLFTSKVLDDRLKSVTHVDGTCRHQTVTPEQNQIFYSLLDKFERVKGIPVLLNTSLNLGGKPIAGTIEEAVELYNTTHMDALCIGNELYIK